MPYEWDIRERRVMTTMTATERALLRSQSGPGRRSTFRHPQSDVATPDPRDGRRLEIVVGPLFGRAQFAVDTTLVSPGRQLPTRMCRSGPSEAAQ